MRNNDDMRIRDILHNVPEGVVNASIHTFNNKKLFEEITGAI